MTVSLGSLEEVARGVTIGVQRRGDADVTDITHDSRRVVPGCLFAAVRGSKEDGHSYLGHALLQGASAALVQTFVDLPLPQLRVASVRAALGPVAAAVYGNPSRGIPLVGVTGTNGKTTVSHLVHSALGSTGATAGLIGTVETRLGRVSTPSGLTTPQAPDLQRILASMRGGGAEAIVMEVSSHALDQRRVAGCHFAVAVFTNLEAEHLDYHGTIEQYYASKALLFTPEYSGTAVVCTDGPWGKRLASQAELPVTTFAANDPSADVRYTAGRRGLSGIEVDITGSLGDTTLKSHLLGLHNAPDVVAAYLSALAVGVEPADAASGIAACERPEGRFELVDSGQPFLVVVDYAHTPRSLTALIDEARHQAGPAGRVTAVVGARGGRDRHKRPDTAKAAGTADFAVLTTDSPGYESPQAILAELRTGLLNGSSGDVTFEADRASAIDMAISRARPGDAVVIAGRGHETTLRRGDLVVELDDREVAEVALARLGYSPASRRKKVSGTPNWP